jgi:hypothetical protein
MNTTVAATNAERAEIPQFHGRHQARLDPAIRDADLEMEKP